MSQFNARVLVGTLVRERRACVSFAEAHAPAHPTVRRPAKIALVRPDKQLITSMRALQTARSENELEFVKAKSTPRQISGELKRLFKLDHLPKRIEAFDVAHISGTNFVAASSVWESGRFVTEDYNFSTSQESSELTALAASVRERLTRSGTLPDLILLDGGKPQMNATLAAILGLDRSNIRFVGAVKPSGKHSAVSYFLAESGERIEFDAYNPAHSMLQLLRDAAHDLSNRAHRDLRDMVHHYELSALLPSITESERRNLMAKIGSIRKIRELTDDQLRSLVQPKTAAKISTDLKNDRSGNSRAATPLIVPISFVAENGDAEDLRPITLR